MSDKKTVEQPSDILRPLTKTETLELLQLYKQKYGHNNFHYLLMYNQNKWNKQLEALENGDDKQWIGFRKNFYTHRDYDFHETGLYISLHYDLLQSVSFNAFESYIQLLYDCLRQTKLIDWSNGPLLTNVDRIYCDQVKNIAREKGVTIQRARTCCGYILSNDEARNLNISKSISAGYRMETLDVNDAEVIHDVWPNKKEGSLEYIRGKIQLNKTLGIYNEDENKLVAWIFQNDFSGIGVLQVLPEVQRQGFGKILTKKLSRLIAESEPVQLNAWIVIENFRSEALLSGVGYEEEVINEWIQLNKITN